MIDAEELDRGPGFLVTWSRRIAAAINQRTPVAGIGIGIDESEESFAISTQDTAAAAAPGGDEGDAAGSAGDGTVKTLYFVEDGVLYTGDFTVANITEV